MRKQLSENSPAPLTIAGVTVATIEDFNEVFHKHLDSDFELLFAAKPPPTEIEIDTFCREIGCALPQDFRCVLTNYCNGFYAAAHESVWPDRKGGAAWMFQRGLYVYGLDGGLPEWISIRHQTPKFREMSRSKLTPGLKIISDPDLYCFTPEGELVRWSHETYEAAPVGSDFFTAFDELLSTLREYKERAKVELVAKSKV